MPQLSPLRKDPHYRQEIKDLLEHLKNILPANPVSCLDGKGEILAVDSSNLTPTPEVIQNLVRLLTGKDEDVATATDDSETVFCIKVSQYNSLLFFREKNDTPFSQEKKAHIKTSVELYFSSLQLRQLQKKLAIQKKQFERKFHVLDNKYQDMLIETQNSHRIIQKQQEKYSQTLQSEIARQTEQLRKSKRAAEAANIAKSQFLAAMSHEIRTPMNGVIGFADILLTTELTEEQKDSALTIKRSGDALLAIINDILDFSKVEAGQMSLEKIDFDPEITAHDVCELIKPRIAEKNIEVICRIDDNLPAKVIGDPGRFRQVLVNLLGNAAKFTEAGEIELGIEVASETDKNIILHNTIRDTGIGIPENKLESIFEPFKQADGSTTRKYGGTGLGLSICRKIAKLMSGKIWAESVPGQGTTFHFTSVMEKSAQQEIAEKIEEKIAGARILIVDENRTSSEILEQILNRAGFSAVIENDMDKVPSLLQQEIARDAFFALCIIGIQPNTDKAFRLAASIRQEGPALGNMPLLAYSSSGERIASKCKEFGIDGFLSKPSRRKIILRTIERLLGGTKYEKDEKKSIVTQYTIREELKQNIRLLLAEDNPVNRKLATAILTKAGYRLDCVNNGKEAVARYTGAPEKYHAILMDIQMPEMDGLTATKKIREAGFAEVPIIAMTANAMKGDRQLCLDAGMTDYISKPVKREIVYEILEKRLFQLNESTAEP